MLKDNARAFSEAENMLFGPKYDELVMKSLSSKKFFGSIKKSRIIQRGEKSSPFEKASYLESEEIGGEECSQLLIKPCNNNTLQKGKEGV